MQDTLTIVLAGGVGSRLSPSPITVQNLRCPLVANIESSISHSRTACILGFAKF